VREPLPADKEAPELPLGESLEVRLGRLTPSGSAPCELHGTIQVPPRTVIACGRSGVWVVELDAARGDRLIERRAVEGSAVGVFSRGGRVWVELQTSIARPLEPPPGAPPAQDDAGTAQFRDQDLTDALRRTPELAPLPPPPELAPLPSSVALRPVAGRVLSSVAGRVVIDLGRGQVMVGDRIEFGVPVEERTPQHSFQRREVAAVGRVTSVSDTRSLVELGIDEVVPIRADAIVTKRSLTSNRSAPPRLAGTWSIAGVLRPFFALDQFGLGSLNEFFVAYADARPLRYQLVLSPLAFAAGDDGDTFAALAVFILSYDTRLFEIGLGLGGQTINDGDYEPGSGLTVSQTLRFGAHDGLNVSVRNDISLFHSEFGYSAFNGQAQIPVSDRGWVVLQGGGGTVGHAFFEVGGKALLRGNGAPGSLFLRGTIGYAALFENADQIVFDPSGFFTLSEERSFGGPLIGLGLEWRL
jgi:hypothetical protein